MRLDTIYDLLEEWHVPDRLTPDEEAECLSVFRLEGTWGVHHG